MFVIARSYYYYVVFQVQVVVELALEIYIFLGSHGELESEISGHNFTIT